MALGMLCIVDRTIPVLCVRADSVQCKRCGGGDISTPVRALPGPRVSVPCPAGAWCRTEARRPLGGKYGSATAGRAVWTCRSRPSFPTDRSPNRDGAGVRAPSVPAAGLWVFHDACSRALAVLFRRRDRCSKAPSHLFFASPPNPSKGDGIDSTAFPEKKAKSYDLDAPLVGSQILWCIQMVKMGQRIVSTSTSRCRFLHARSAV